ncbi:MAG: lysylphosphatidylglycerol synthase transmembrane domain-containing protein [archaeon]
MEIKKILPGFIGLIIFGYILSTIDLGKLLINIQKANFAFLGLAVLAVILSLILHGLKWQTIIKHYGKAPSLFESVRIFCVGTMIGFLTPLKLGIFIRSAYIKHLGLQKAVASVLADRATDIIFVCFIAMLSIFALNLEVVFMPSQKIIMLFLILIAAIIAFSIKRFRSKITDIANETISAISNKKTIIPLIFLTPAAFLSTVLIYYLIAQSLSINLSLTFLLMVVSITILIETMPITFLGLGTREAGMIFMLAMKGISAESAVTVSLLYLFTNYITLSVIGLSKLINLWNKDQKGR